MTSEGEGRLPAGWNKIHKSGKWNFCFLMENVVIKIRMTTGILEMVHFSDIKKYFSNFSNQLIMRGTDIFIKGSGLYSHPY